MKHISPPCAHPLEVRGPNEPAANLKATQLASAGSQTDDSRQDTWGGIWFRIQLEPFWNRFLKKGIEERTLDAAHFKIFLLLTTLMGSRNEIFQSQEELGGLVKLKPSRVSEVLKDLEAMGCLQRIGGRRKGAFIRLDPNLVTRSSRSTHLKAMEEWNEEVDRREREKSFLRSKGTSVPF